jgi:hypothetical protein
VQTRCDVWSTMDPLDAKAFFVDRVWDAVVAVEAQDDFKDIESPDGSPSWVKFNDSINPATDAWRVERGFKRTITALQEYNK